AGKAVRQRRVEMTLNERYDIEHGLVFAPGDLVGLVSPLLRAAPQRHGQLGSWIGHRFLGRFLLLLGPLSLRSRAGPHRCKCSKHGSSPKAGGGWAAEPKNPALRPRRRRESVVYPPRAPPLKAGRAESPLRCSGQRKCRRQAQVFQKQDSPGAIGTQLQRPLFGGVPVLRGGNAMEFHRRRFLRLTAAAVAGLFASPLAWAQDYPARAVTIVVPFTPGGSTDIIARMLAQKLEQRLGKSFVVENRPGAGTIIAASAVAKAAPDGYLLLMAPSSTMAVNVTLYKKL